MGRQWTVFALGFYLAWMVGCASSDRQFMAESDTNSQADGAAFTGDSMLYRKLMPVRNYQPLEFYYKHCTELGSQTYYSKTAYGCTDPY